VIFPTLDSNRTRFAPNVSGPLHLGNARTAIFSWLWARGTESEFWLRLDDDPFHQPHPGSTEQFKKGEIENQINQELRWLGLDWEGMYRLSERRGLAMFFADNYKDVDSIRPGQLLIDSYLLKSNTSVMPFVFTSILDDCLSGSTTRIRGCDLVKLETYEQAAAKLMDLEFPKTYYVPVLGDQYNVFHKTGEPVWTLSKCREEGMNPQKVFHFLFDSIRQVVDPCDTMLINTDEMARWVADNIKLLHTADYTTFNEEAFNAYCK